MKNFIKSKITSVVGGLMVTTLALVMVAMPTPAKALTPTECASAQVALVALGIPSATVTSLLAAQCGGSGSGSGTGATYDLGTATMKVGSSGTYVKNLQLFLDNTLVADGSFGPKTKASVVAWQLAHTSSGTADGIVGPNTRAAMIATMGGSGTAGQCADGLDNDADGKVDFGAAITNDPDCTSALDTTEAAGVQAGPVTASLATNNPAASVLVAGQATADLAHFAFTGTGVVTNVTLKRIGVSSDATPSNVYLFDGATRLTDAASVSNTGMVTFNVPAGIFTVTGTKTISVKSDIAASTSGQTVGMMLASFMTSGTTVATTANISGNIHSIASATLATVSAGTVTPSSATLNPGAGVTVWQSTLSISNRDVWMKRLALRQTGSAPASSFQNLKLYVNGVQAGTAAGVDAMGYVTFDLNSAPVLLVAGSRVVRVDADIVSGASRTVQFSLRQAADVDFVDSSFGVNITPTSTPWTCSGTCYSTISGSSGGTLTIEKDVSSPSTNLVNSGSDVNLGTFKFTAYGEAIKVETLRATYTSSDAAIGSLRNGRILIGGVQYGSSATLNEDSQATPYTSYTVNYTFMPGVPVMVEIHSDIYDNDGTDSITAGTDTVTAVLAVGSSNAVRQDSLGSFNAPSSAVSANTRTIASTTATLTKNANYADQSTVVPATNFKVGSWNLAGSSVEDILLTTLSFDIQASSGTEFTALDMNNVYVVVKSGETVVAQPSPIATVGATDNNFSINYTLLKNSNVTVELFANLADDGLASTIDDGDSVTTDLTVTGTAMISGSSVNASSGDIAGQIIAQAAATLTVSKDASAPVTGIVYDNQTVTTLAAKFAAVTAGYNVTDITLTLGTNASTVVQNVMLYDGATLVATKPGGASTVTFTGLTWNVPANTNKVLTVKLQLGTVGVGAGTSGAAITTSIAANTDFTATNTSTGVSAVGAGTASGSAIYAYASIPTITQDALASSSLLNTVARPLIRFTMTGNGGDIAWDQLTFKVNKDDATTVGTNATTGITLWDVTAGGNTSVGGTFTNGAQVYGATTTCATVTCDIGFVPTTEQVVSGSKTYELRGNIAASVAAGDYVTVTLDNDSTAVVAKNDVATILAADTDAPLIWSDMSAASHATTTTDWTTDFGVKNLPVSGTMTSPL